jgi:hypothetical protein
MSPTSVGHDYYEILGISHNATPATVKSAYKRLALARHPDRRKGEPDATADFQLVRLIAICYLPFQPPRLPRVVIDTVKNSLTKLTGSWLIFINAENTTSYITQQYFPEKSGVES